MKHFFSFLLLLLSLSLPSSCDKLPRNGLLDGHWQLTHINQRDVKSERIYWGVQLDLLEWFPGRAKVALPQDKEGITARFVYEGKTLRITQAYVMVRGNDRNLRTDDTFDMSAIGVPSIPTSYQIEHIDGASMMLRNAKGEQLRFRKF